MCGCRRNRPAVSQDFARRTVLSFAFEIRRADSAKQPQFWVRPFAAIAWQFNPMLPVRMVQAHYLRRAGSDGADLLTPRTSQLIPDSTKYNNKNNRNSKHPD